MGIIYDKIRLDTLGKEISIVDSDWALNLNGGCIQHEPTQTVFRVGEDERKEGAPFSTLNFWAEFVAIGPNRALPTPDEVETLGQSAILIHLIAFGILPVSALLGTDTNGTDAKTYAC